MFLYICNTCCYVSYVLILDFHTIKGLNTSQIRVGEALQEYVLREGN